MKAESDRMTPEGRRPLIVATIGFSLFYALCVSFFYSTWLLGNTSFSTQTFDNVLNPSMFIVAFALSALVRPLALSKRAVCPVAGYTALTAAVALLYAITVAQGTSLLVAVAAACAGAGMSLVAPYYFAALANFAPKQIALACGIMSLAGMALDIAWSPMPPLALLVVQLIALALSAACLIRMPQPGGVARTGAGSLGTAEVSRAGDAAGTTASPGRGTASVPAEPSGRLGHRNFLNAFLVSGVGTFALSVVYGIIDAAASGAGSSAQVAASISKFGGIIAAVMFLLYFAAAKRSSPTLLFNVVFGLLATAMIFLPFLPRGYMVALNIFVAAGWKLVMLSLFYLVTVAYAHDRTRLLTAIALAYALPRLGLFMGLNIALFLQIDKSADFVLTTAVAFFLLYLILMAVWLVNAHERRRAIQEMRAAYEKLDRYAHDQEDLRKTRCSELVAEYGLTNREADIVLLLAQGRDAAFISETLFLSRNTVKSYQKSIYAKLGVHSKQEVIDLFAPPPLS